MSRTSKKEKNYVAWCQTSCDVALGGTPNYRKRYTYSSDKAYLFVRHPILHLGMLLFVLFGVLCQHLLIAAINTVIDLSIFFKQSFINKVVKMDLCFFQGFLNLSYQDVSRW